MQIALKQRSGLVMSQRSHIRPLFVAKLERSACFYGVVCFLFGIFFPWDCYEVINILLFFGVVLVFWNHLNRFFNIQSTLHPLDESEVLSSHSTLQLLQPAYLGLICLTLPHHSFAYLLFNCKTSCPLLLHLLATMSKIGWGQFALQHNIDSIH